MHQIKSIAALIICLFLLSGCTQITQPEDLAFAIVLGVDLTDGGEIEVSIVVPRIAGQSGQEGSGGSASDHLVFSAASEDFSEALNHLRWAVPRRLDLSQIKLIVFSEQLAQSEHCRKVSDTIMATPRLYTAARLAVCDGSAKEFVTAIKPTIGSRLSSELDANIEDYILNGYIPDVTFADVYYKSRSEYSDTLAIYAAAAPSESAPASIVIPNDPLSAKVDTQSDSRFLGAAIFREGRLTGILSGKESLYCKILRGERQAFPFSTGGRTIGLTTLGKPEYQINIHSDPMTIDVCLRFSQLAGSRFADPEKLSDELEKEILKVIDTCRKMNAEPFLIAEKTASQFASMADWQAFDWHEKFKNCTIRVHINLQMKES